MAPSSLLSNIITMENIYRNELNQFIYSSSYLVSTYFWIQLIKSFCVYMSIWFWVLYSKSYSLPSIQIEFEACSFFNVYCGQWLYCNDIRIGVRYGSIRFALVRFNGESLHLCGYISISIDTTMVCRMSWLRYGK